MIDERRANDMTGYLLSKRRSGEMEYKKLMGLMYLAERESIKRYRDLISYDDFEAKEHGPVLSETYKLMKGERVSSVKAEWCDDLEDGVLFDVWNSMFNKLDGDYISIKEKVNLDDIHEVWTKLGSLSESEYEILDEIWEEFGKLTEPELREYIRKNCPEWEHTVRGKGRRYEDKESFPNQITIDIIGEKMELSQSKINGVKHNLELHLEFRS